MAMLTWMADVLRGAGLPVREIAGWKTRGHGALADPAPLGVLAHHTAGPATGNYPSENVVVNGRTGLPGPLANLGLARDGTWIVVAAGQAWHAGRGSISWCPTDQGNSHLIGVEAESVGTRDDWTAQQRTNYPRGVAALLRHLRLPAERAIGHKEWAPGRKIDPAFWDMNAFRGAVRTHLTSQTGDWLAMATIDDLRKVIREELGRTVWETTGVLPNRRGPGGAQAGAYADTLFGYMMSTDGAAYRIEQAVAKLAAQHGTGGGGSLSDADVNRVAAAVLDLLAKRAAA